MLSQEIYSGIPEYYHPYLHFLESEDLRTELLRSENQSLELFKSILPEKENFSYADGKWTVKQVIQHIVDTERVFAYRALRFSRHDDTALKGFDENLFAQNFQMKDIPLQDIIDDYLATRTSTLMLYKNLTDEMLDFQGIVIENMFSARQIGYLIAAHNFHHCHILKERYF